MKFYILLLLLLHKEGRGPIFIIPNKILTGGSWPGNRKCHQEQINIFKECNSKILS